MEQQPNSQRAERSAAVAALLSAGAGAGIGWILWLATDNNAIAIGMAGPIAVLSNNFLRNILK